VLVVRCLALVRWLSDISFEFLISEGQLTEKFLGLGNIDKATNITKAGKETVFGGTTYSAITARKLGLDTTVLTRGNEELKDWLATLEKMDIRTILEADKSTLTVTNDYSLGGDWVQKLLAKTGKIRFDVEDNFDIIHVNPLYKEIDTKIIRKARKQSKLLSIEVAGLVRNARNGIVTGNFIKNREQWFEGIDIVHFNERERKFVSRETEPRNVCEDIQSSGPKIVLYTVGENGAFVLGREFIKIPAFKIKEVDPTGAGDVFTTSFGIRYFETENEKESGLFATAAASYKIEDFGSKNIQSRERIEERARMLTEKAG
jgi:sugar/nucleoside kinase (ribokinase family)